MHQWPRYSPRVRNGAPVLAAAPVMAEPENKDAGALSKGTVCPVTIEEATPQLLVVTLEHETQIFRGVLMDTTNK